MLKRILSMAIAALALSSALHATAPAPNRDQAVFEVRFLTEMIDHHAMAIMMADLCAGRTIHPQLLQLCHQIKETQLEEVATMQTWLEDWYGLEHEPAMTPGMETHMRKLAALSGAEFEIEFMKMMIRHHQTAVVRTQDCQRKAYHASLIELCHHMEMAQRAEIELMGAWLCDWFDICNFHGSLR